MLRLAKAALQTLLPPGRLVRIESQKRQEQTGSQLSKPSVFVEKVPQLMLVAVRGSGYKQARVPDVGVHGYLRRPASHDGKPLALGIAVPLLPRGRSGS